MKTRLTQFFLGLAVVLAGAVTAATFNLFQPATGILKGDENTYVTTAAASSDIVATFSGTCNNSSTYLRSDGTCNVPPGVASAGGADTNVQYNSAGAFAGSNDFTWTNATRTLSIGATGDAIIAPVVNASGAGRSLTIRGGVSSLSGQQGGPLNLLSGFTTASGSGGNLNVTAQSGNVTGNGGHVFISAGAGAGSGGAGGVTVSAGAVNQSGATAGTVQINGGGGLSAGAHGGNVQLSAGSPIDGNGGSLLLNAANGVGTNRNGGSITANLGAATGAGTAGLFSVLGGRGMIVGAPAGGAQGLGTINATGLFVNGVAVGSGSGTVTSVGLTMPSGFSVANSPVTTSGTLAVTTALNGPLRGNGSGFITGSLALGSEVSGTLAVANGGTGTTTSTGTGSVVLSASPALTGSPTINGQNVCRADGTGCPASSGMILCTTACNISAIAVGQSAMIRKGSATSRASTNTTALDPDLQFTSIPLGQYNIEARPFFTGGAGGFGYQFFSTVALGGLLLSNSGLAVAPPSGTPCSTFAGGISTAVLTIHTTPGSYTCTSISSGGWFIAVDDLNYVPGVGGGTMGLDWAQASSNGTATVMETESWMKITRIQ